MLFLTDLNKKQKISVLHDMMFTISSHLPETQFMSYPSLLQLVKKLGLMLIIACLPPSVVGADTEGQSMSEGNVVLAGSVDSDVWYSISPPVRDKRLELLRYDFPPDNSGMFEENTLTYAKPTHDAWFDSRGQSVFYEISSASKSEICVTRRKRENAQISDTEWDRVSSACKHFPWWKEKYGKECFDGFVCVSSGKLLVILGRLIFISDAGQKAVVLDSGLSVYGVRKSDDNTIVYWGNMNNHKGGAVKVAVYQENNWQGGGELVTPSPVLAAHIDEGGLITAVCSGMVVEGRMNERAEVVYGSFGGIKSSWDRRASWDDMTPSSVIRIATPGGGQKIMMGFKHGLITLRTAGSRNEQQITQWSEKWYIPEEQLTALCVILDLRLIPQTDLLE